MAEEFSLDDFRRQILPRSASDVYRNRLRYLASTDLTSFKPALHMELIKEMFRKFSMKWEIDIKNLDEIINSANVLEVTCMLKVLRDIQKDLKIKNLQLGAVFFDEDNNCFKYFNFKTYSGLQK
jgi:hypothetical protein